MKPALKLLPVKIGQTFTHPSFTGGRIETYTRLADATEPRWSFEPFVIQAHGSDFMDEMIFEQGQRWFEVRGFTAV
jgi:hypothetical protein